MAICIKPNREIIENINPKNGTDFTLEEVYAYVGSPVQLLDVSENEYALINEEGKYRDMDYNSLATELLDGIIFPGDYIVGNMMIVNKSQFK